MKSILNNKELLESLIKANYTYSDVLIAFGLKLTGGNQKTLKIIDKKIKESKSFSSLTSDERKYLLQEYTKHVS